MRLCSGLGLGHKFNRHFLERTDRSVYIQFRMKSGQKSSLSPRERILKTASDLFYAQGVRAVGVDTIIAEARVAKASFYKHFPSKDDLILAFLDRRDALLRTWLEQAVQRLSPDPANRPLAIFDALAQRIASNDFRGCAFINAMVELADRDHLAHQAADRHKREMTAFIAQLLNAANVARPNDLAKELTILMDGAIVTALREGSPDAARAAKRIAAVLLRDAGRS
jgi:AcrR family transcriptional regulator